MSFVAAPQTSPVLLWVLARLSRRTRALAIAVALLSLAARLGALATAWLVADGRLDRAGIIGVVTAVLLTVKRGIATAARVEAESEMHRAVARALLRADVIEEPALEPQLTIGDGIHASTDWLTHAGPVLVSDLAAAIPAAIALAAVMTTRLFVAASLGGIAMGTVLLLLRGRIARLHERAYAAHGRLAEALATVLHGRLELVASSAEAPALDVVGRRGEVYVAEARRAAVGVALLGRAPFAAAVVVVGLVVLAVGDAPALVAGATWTTQARPLIVLSAALPILLGLAFGAYDLVRLRERLRPFGAIVQRPERAELGRGRSLPEPVRAILVDHVTFRYREGGPAILRELRTDWRRGLLVLRGPNGSGKSTLLRLLAGLRDPEAGRFLLGDVALTDVDRERLRARVAFLPQRPYLGAPHCTIAEALRLTSADASEPEQRRALERVGLWRMLGDDALGRAVGDLSVGQRQRLALARVLLRDAEIFLLDEPDAFLDTEGVATLTAILDELAQTKLVAIAAHGELATALRGTVVELAAAERPRDSGHLPDCKEP